jgi:hypothetical protein
MKAHALLLTALVGVTFASPGRAAPPAEPIEAIVCRGVSAEGFSYAWGGECWCASGCSPDLTSCSPGDCTPNPGSSGCPDCTHSGTYGADCSGFVSKAWQVPDPYPVEACGVDRYVASSFTADHQYWDVVSMASLQPADAVASSTHVILVIAYEDAYGEHEVVEASGCNPGIIRHSRTFSSSYSGARRTNLTACVCAEGDEETEACGDCGSRTRICEGGCMWSEWSACEGPNPLEETACAIEGSTGQCALGARLCVAGWLTCQPELASTEICDGVDNDCDGVTDNGTPASLGEGYACTNGCGEAVSECIDGVLRCVTPGTTWPDDSCNAGEGGGSGNAGVTGGDDESGCSCRAPGGSAPGRGASWLMLGALLAMGRRQRGRFRLRTSATSSSESRPVF